jgi:hypothetical protein
VNSTSRLAWVAAALIVTLPRGVSGQDLPTPPPRVPIVIAAGCARPTEQPEVWTLTAAGRHRESASPSITRDEQEFLAASPPGNERYLLVGVAEFVSAEASRTVGVRGHLLPASRVNATGMLADGQYVAVKGLYIAGDPQRINLTSVVDLGRQCAR